MSGQFFFPVANGLWNASHGGFRNKIMNGEMEIAQAGTSFAGLNAAANATTTLDGWVWACAGSTAVVTASQQADVPADNEFQNSLRVAVTTADAAVAAGDVVGIYQAIEGYFVRDLIGRPIAVQFWVRSSKTGIHCVAFTNSISNRSYITEFNIETADTWELNTVEIPEGLITAGTWSWVNGTGLRMCFTLMAGTTFQTTAGAWQTGNFFSTANQVNCMDTVGNIFAVTGVQVQHSYLPTAFEHVPYDARLARAQRYYEKSYNDGVNPATVALPGSHNTIIHTGGLLLTAGSIPFKVTKRIVPTMTLYSTNGGTAGSASEYNAAGTFVADRTAAASSIGMNGFHVALTAAGTVGNQARVQWAANSRLT